MTKKVKKAENASNASSVRNDEVLAMWNLKYGQLEEISAEIGYTATNALVDWFGGGVVCIPRKVGSSETLQNVLGAPALAHLVKKYGGMKIHIPLGYQREIDRRDRMVVALFLMGLNEREIGHIASLTSRHCLSIKANALKNGTMLQIEKRLENYGRKLKSTPPVPAMKVRKS